MVAMGEGSALRGCTEGGDPDHRVESLATPIERREGVAWGKGMIMRHFFDERECMEQWREQNDFEPGKKEM